MRAPTHQPAEDVGIHAVCAAFARLGWGAAPNPLRDLGTDLWIAARDERRFERGLIMGAQVKSGSSYFDQQITRTDGELMGWWYYEPDARHFEDWVRHGLPHLMILYDDTEQVAYWQHVTIDRVEVTGVGCKITVPKTQTINGAHLDALMAVAATQRAASSLEGSAWGAGAAAASPASRLRFALMAPRLIAPHRNAGFERALEPEEAVALIVQARVDDYMRFAERHDAVPNHTVALASRDWRWNFAGALWNWLVESEPEELYAVLSRAPSAHTQAAAAVACACALTDSDRFEDAITTVNSVVEAALPIDVSWLLVHRAGLRVEIGEIAEAREDAAAAQRALIPEPTDVTASALAGAAAWLLFQTADWHRADVGTLVQSADTAISWWRSQPISAGLRDIATRRFRQWADDRAFRFGGEHEANNQLLAARVNAQLTGDRGAWRYPASLLARHTLLETHQSDDNDGVADALNSLRACADDEGLKLAVGRVWRIGPLEAIREASKRIDERSWTYTTGRTNLRLWETGGDAVAPEDADAAVSLCLELLTTDDHWIAQRTRPRFRGDLAVTDAMNGVLPAASDSPLRSCLHWVVGLPLVQDELMARSVATTIGLVKRLVLTSQEISSARAAAALQTHPLLTSALNGLLVSHGDADARLALIRHAGEGDFRAVAELEDVTLLPSEVAATLICACVDAADRIRTRASSHTFDIGGTDTAYALAILNMHFTEIAQWAPLLDLVADPAVAAHDKQRACAYLAMQAHALPSAVADSLRSALPALDMSTSTAPDPWGESLGAIPSALAAALGQLVGDELESRVTKLLEGDWQERRDLAWILGASDNPRLAGVLVGMTFDDHIEVRASVASALTRRANRGASGTLEESALRRLATSPGALLPLSVLSTIPREEQLVAEPLRHIASGLVNHSSARVREAARAVAPDSSSGDDMP